jgi:hypothetical protein
MDTRTIALLVATAIPLAAGDGYVGSKSCAGCHKALYDNYVKTPMGRAASPAASHLALAPQKSVVQHDKFPRTFEVWVQDGKLYQSEAGADFRSVHEVAYAIGSGENGLSFMVKRGDYLFQAPLSYYSRAGRWGLSPGYEYADQGFNRPIATMCIACHSGRPQPVAQRPGQFLDPPFRELSIGCESCHGPGERHVQSKGAKAAIVNPAKLPTARAEEVCMNCHQGGDTRILQPGKSALDFRPGRVLDDTVAIFKIPRTRETAKDTDLLEHHESMRMSRCYRESGAKLNCITCHNPHLAKPDYRAACLGCHKTAFAASHPGRDSDCVACHMPKRDVGFIAHSALTNHRIVRTRDQGLPDAAFDQATIDLPDLVHFNRVPGKRLPLMTRMQAYGELADRQPAYVEKYKALLDRAAAEEPDNVLVLAALGRRALREGGIEDAVKYLNRAVERGSEAYTTYEDFSGALAQAGRVEESAKALRRGIELSPFTPVLHKTLALRYITLKRYAEAKQTLEHYMELFPEDDFVRKLLAQVSGGR